MTKRPQQKCLPLPLTMSIYLHCTQHCHVLPPPARALILLLDAEPTEETSALHLLPVFWETAEMAMTGVQLRMLLKLPAFKVPGEGCVPHTSGSPCKKKPYCPTLLYSQFPPFTGWELQAGYFMSPHLSSCKIGLKNTYPTELE